MKASTSKLQKHVYCSANITPKMHDVFVSFVLSQKNVAEYIIYLTSPGGSPWAGFNLYSFVKSRPEETTVYNMGNVDSAAVQFFLGFKRRFAVSNSSFMVHPTTFSKDPLPQFYSLFDARKAAHEIDSIETKTVSIILAETAGRGGEELTATAVREAMFHTTVIPAEQALRQGIIDAIEQPILPESDVLYLTETYLASLPSGPQPPPSSPPPSGSTR
jgi:ATP-dependent protease ClpP protease subunit